MSRGFRAGVSGTPASIPRRHGASRGPQPHRDWRNTTDVSQRLPDAGKRYVSDRIGTSTINLNAGAIEANQVIVGLGPDATGGPTTDVCVYNAVGTIDFVLDANGWFGSADAPLGTQFQAIGPTRVCDTRAGSGTPCAGHTLVAGGTLVVDVAGVAGVPGTVRSPSLPTSLRSPRPGTYLTAYPATPPRPNASDLNSRESGAPEPRRGRSIAARACGEHPPVQRDRERERTSRC